MTTRGVLQASTDKPAGLPSWAQLVGWSTIVGSGLMWLAEAYLGAGLAHRQPIVTIVGVLSLGVAHVWFLVAFIWLVRRWWQGSSVPGIDRFLIGLVALEVAYPYLVDFVKYGS